MPEQKEKSYMAQLDEWIENNVVEPLGHGKEYSLQYDDPVAWSSAVNDVKKAIREKVYESYKNGRAAVPASRSSQVIAAIERKPFRPQKQRQIQK